MTPFQSERDDAPEPQQRPGDITHWFGGPMPRWTYLGISAGWLALALVLWFAHAAFVEEFAGYVIWAVRLLLAAVFFVASVRRAVDIGSGKWIPWLMFLPVLGVFAWLYLFINHGRSDRR